METRQIGKHHPVYDALVNYGEARHVTGNYYTTDIGNDGVVTALHDAAIAIWKKPRGLR